MQDKIKEMINDGIKVVACKKCAENMYIEYHLADCHVELSYSGKFLSEWHNQKPLMTF